MSPFIPVSQLETQLSQAQGGQLPVADLMKALVAAELVVPSAGQVWSDGSGFEPLLFSKDGMLLVACFTDRSRIAEYTEMAPHFVMMRGDAFFKGVPEGYGVAENPGQEVGFEISPQGLGKVIEDFCM